MAKTDWKLEDVVQPKDFNDIGGEINQLRSDVDNIEVPEGSLTQKGIVQLSNATDSTDQDRAATPAAVKAAYDVADAAETPAGAQEKIETYAQNKIAKYQGAVEIDPNTTTDSFIITSHPNSPINNIYWYIQTFFYSSTINNRAQIAQSYPGGTTAIYMRRYHSGTWYPWVELINSNGGTLRGNLRIAGTGESVGIEKIEGATLNIDFTDISTNAANMRIFRNTNTTGDKTFVLHTGDGQASSAFRILNGNITHVGGLSTSITSGSGSPQGVVPASPGSIYLNRQGSAGTSLYIKESGTGNTGWRAV